MGVRIKHNTKAGYDKTCVNQAKQDKPEELFDLRPFSLELDYCWYGEKDYQSRCEKIEYRGADLVR